MFRQQTKTFRVSIICFMYILQAMELKNAITFKITDCLSPLNYWYVLMLQQCSQFFSLGEILNESYSLRQKSPRKVIPIIYVG